MWMPLSYKGIAVMYILHGESFMKALVTGASGFIGKHLCAELRRRGHYVFESGRDSFNNIEKIMLKNEINTQ